MTAAVIVVNRSQYTATPIWWQVWAAAHGCTLAVVSG